jgi:hypothetical protein
VSSARTSLVERTVFKAEKRGATKRAKTRRQTLYKTKAEVAREPTKELDFVPLEKDVQNAFLFLRSLFFVEVGRADGGEVERT